MKINRIILKGVNNFENLDLTLKDEWTGNIPDSLLLMGINGSGKTTILRAIHNFWWVLGEILSSYDKDHIKIPVSSQLAHYHFAALEIHDLLPNLLGNSVWICLGEKHAIEQLASENETAFFISASPTASIKSEKIKYSFVYNAPITLKADIDNVIENLVTRYRHNMLGGEIDLPNMVFIPSEGRTIHQITIDSDSIEPEQDSFYWIASYRPITKRKNSEQNYLLSIMVKDEEKYKLIIKNVNQFLTGKKISGFNKRTLELEVMVDNGETHPIHLLSSGEKQVLLLITYITRHLQVGGIVLIDEPELHLHTSLSTAFVSFISRMVSEQQGQLILASHDTDIWQSFSTSQRINLNEV